RSTDTLADAVRYAEDEKLPRSNDHSDQGAGHGSQRVAEDDETLAPSGLVRLSTRPQFQEARNGVGQALDDAQVKTVAKQDREQEVGQQREDHLAGNVVEQAGSAQHLDVSG